MSRDMVNIESFEARLSRIDQSVRKSQRAAGYTRTGMYDQAEADRQNARRFRISWKTVLKSSVIVWVCFLGLRGFLASEMGATAYEARIAELREGTTAQVVASYAMERGPVLSVLQQFIMRAKEKRSEAMVGATRNGHWVTDDDALWVLNDPYEYEAYAHEFDAQLLMVDFN